MAKTSFNLWIKCQNGELAAKWVSRRGRLTRDSVEARAVREYNAKPGDGASAYDAYLASVFVIPNPKVEK